MPIFYQKYRLITAAAESFRDTVNNDIIYECGTEGSKFFNKDGVISKDGGVALYLAPCPTSLGISPIDTNV